MSNSTSEIVNEQITDCGHYLIMAKVDGSEIYPMEQPDYGRPMVDDIVTANGRDFYQVKGRNGDRTNGHLWLLADVPAGVKAVAR